MVARGRVGVAIKGQHERDLCVSGTVLNYKCGDGFTNLYT